MIVEGGDEVLPRVGSVVEGVGREGMDEDEGRKGGRRGGGGVVQVKGDWSDGKMVGEVGEEQLLGPAMSNITVCDKTDDSL